MSTIGLIDWLSYKYLKSIQDEAENEGRCPGVIPLWEYEAHVRKGYFHRDYEVLHILMGSSKYSYNKLLVPYFYAF